jgi:enoyl-[acyl-carrier protein] reductase II
LIKNEFYKLVEEAYESNASEEQLKVVLGRGRAKKGMFEGDLVNGELEIGQVASQINTIMSASEVVSEIIGEFNLALKEQNSKKFQF